MAPGTDREPRGLLRTIWERNRHNTCSCADYRQLAVLITGTFQYYLRKPFLNARIRNGEYNIYLKRQKTP